MLQTAENKNRPQIFYGKEKTLKVQEYIPNLRACLVYVQPSVKDTATSRAAAPIDKRNQGIALTKYSGRRSCDMMAAAYIRLAKAENSTAHTRMAGNTSPLHCRHKMQIKYNTIMLEVVFLRKTQGFSCLICYYEAWLTFRLVNSDDTHF